MNSLLHMLQHAQGSNTPQETDIFLERQLETIINIEEWTFKTLQVHNIFDIEFFA